MISEFVTKNPVLADAIFIIGGLASLFTIITFFFLIFKSKNLHHLNFFKRLVYKSKIKFHENTEDAKYYHKQIWLDKLFSNDVVKQSTAIREMMQLCNPDEIISDDELSDNINWVFKRFAERYGSKPELSDDNRDLILHKIIIVVKKK